MLIQTKANEITTPTQPTTLYRPDLVSPPTTLEAVDEA